MHVSTTLWILDGCFGFLPASLGLPTGHSRDPCSHMGHILVTHVGQTEPVGGTQMALLLVNGHGQI